MRKRLKTGARDPRVVARRRSLRRHATDAEQRLWRLLRARRWHGVKFRRQCSIGPFIVDFLCIERKLVIEVDGEYHDYVVARDLQRQRYLEQLGYTVLRFENRDVMRDLEAVAMAIGKWLDEHPA